MRQLIIFVILLLAMTGSINAQDNNNNPASKLAQHIAQKMTDSLGLNAKQMVKIYGINIQLSEQKTKAMTSQLDKGTISGELQRIEYSRDSLYKEVLTERQYELYKIRKPMLISRN